MLNHFSRITSFRLLLTATLLFGVFSCTKNEPQPPGQVPYNLDVVLTGGIKSIGYVAFRQDPGRPHIITLDTKVLGLEPLHTYWLQRAVDSLDENCTSTTWLTLGEGLEPHAIVTDMYGNGEAALYRDVSAIPSGSTFDIHFQVVDTVSKNAVLTSECYQYQVR